MPQIQLPVFPEGVTLITSELAFCKRDGQVTYFNGLMPVFTHAADDVATFRMITSQFVVNGNTTQTEISRAFGVPLGTVKRYTKLYREKGPAGFYAVRATRGASVLTPAVLSKVQERLDAGQSESDIASELSLKKDTLKKAVKAGRLHKVVKKTLLSPT